MKNSDIIKIFKLTGDLMELHGENPFKIKSYASISFRLENVENELAGMPVEEIEKIEGVSKNLAAKITDLIQTGSFAEFQELVEKTPEGVIKMLGLKGIGPKKINTIWKELGVESLEGLLEACEEDKVSKLKGFGAKTQDAIRQSLLFMDSNKGKLHYATAEVFAEDLIEKLTKLIPDAAVALTGAIRRKIEIIDLIEVVIGTTDIPGTMKQLDTLELLQKEDKRSSPFTWYGLHAKAQVPVRIFICQAEKYIETLFLTTGSEEHLRLKNEAGKTLIKTARNEKYKSEKEIYEKAGFSYFEPELREGFIEKIPADLSLLHMKELKGILHNHSTYSDGRHTLEEMALYCKELGYEYLGISDHSKSAFYANGLMEFKVKEQQAEIEKLNEKLAPFKIFKGIESDILNDGSLDYDADVLGSFDFIVASIHSNLKMDVSKATSRLITAIENPYTTMLGHPTGRLLLKREGYPIDHKAVIDACAENGVIIEINANPWRLDMDWRWVHYALEKGVKLSINPDAHDKAEYLNMYYGVLVGRKGGLTKEMTFNSLGVTEIDNYFKARKQKITG